MARNLMGKMHIHIGHKVGVDEIFSYVHVRSKSEPEFKISIYDMYKKNSLHTNKISNSIVVLLSCFLRPKCKKKYVFWGTKFKDLILTLPREDVLVIGGPKQLLFCMVNQISFRPALTLWSPIYKYMRGNLGDIREIEDAALEIFEDISRYWSEISYFIIENDSLPIQRLMIIFAKKFGISEVICLQHGVFQRSSPNYVLDGWWCDRFFAIDFGQYDVLVDAGVPQEKIVVMGFHSEVYKPQRAMSEPKYRKCCILGQPWVRYGKEKGDKYLLIVKRLVDTLQKHGYAVTFKPHPWENGLKYLKDFESIERRGLNSAIEDYDVFLSLTSTALFQAAWSGRLSVQVFDDIFECDHFNSLGPKCCIDFNDDHFEYDLIDTISSKLIGAESRVRPVSERFLGALRKVT
ncbi:hypothetical protein [Marinobacter sp.]|uniref:hypothetical protein n=1 Tax=Marinobacter sp. TaxID=50741 RepID=UPI003A95649D